MYTPVLITPPADDLIVPLADMKAYLREDTDDHDDVIESLIKSATEFLDGWEGVLGRALLEQTYELRFGNWNCPMRIPLVPFDLTTGVVEINYIDADGNAAVLGSSNYYALQDAIGPFVVWTRDHIQPALGNTRKDLVGLRFTVGYADVASVPENIKLIIKQLVVHWFENRGPVVLGKTIAHLPLHIKQLITRIRRVGLS